MRSPRTVMLVRLGGGVNAFVVYHCRCSDELPATSCARGNGRGNRARRNPLKELGKRMRSCVSRADSRIGRIRSGIMRESRSLDPACAPGEPFDVGQKDVPLAPGLAVSAEEESPEMVDPGGASRCPLHRDPGPRIGPSTSICPPQHNPGGLDVLHTLPIQLFPVPVWSQYRSSTPLCFTRFHATRL